MKQPWRPRVVPSNEPDMSELAKRIAAYRAALVAQGIGDDLADRLTVEFQTQLLSLAFGLAAGSTETK